MGRAWGADLLRAGAIEQLPEERNDADQTEHEEDDAKPDAVKRCNYSKRPDRFLFPSGADHQR